MSHFSVLVIGNDVEKQLAPYHEFECTGVNDEYVQEIDVTEEVQADIAERGFANGLDHNYGLFESRVDDESKLDRDGDHKYGYAIVKDDKLVKAVRRTNPNKKWDWYQIGGRWSGHFVATQEANALPSGHPNAPKKGNPGLMGSESNAAGVDQALKSQIDFETMRNMAQKAAEDRYDAVVKAKQEAGLSTDATWHTWEHVRDVLHKGDIEAARKMYREQPAVEAIRRLLNNPFMDIDRFLCPRDEYIQTARDAAITTYAVVKDGEWFAKGEMGWFGMSSDDMTQAEWNRKFNELIDSLPDDTLLTVVDCHI